MGSIDIYHNSKVLVAMNYQICAGAATYTGNIIDMANFEAAVFACCSGTVATAQGYWIIQEGDESDMSDAATATAILGAPVMDDDADDHRAFRMGYTGGKRYVRPAFVGDGSAVGQYLFAVAFLLMPASGPVAVQDT